MSKPINGVLPILHTPFTADDRIDQVSFQRQIDWAFSVGADGVCLAMVSELLRLTTDERIELTRAMCEMVDGRGVVIASVGAESTKAAVEFARHAESRGTPSRSAVMQSWRSRRSTPLCHPQRFSSISEHWLTKSRCL